MAKNTTTKETKAQATQKTTPVAPVVTLESLRKVAHDAMDKFNLALAAELNTEAERKAMTDAMEKVNAYQRVADFVTFKKVGEATPDDKNAALKAMLKQGWHTLDTFKVTNDKGMPKGILKYVKEDKSELISLSAATEQGIVPDALWKIALSNFFYWLNGYVFTHDIEHSGDDYRENVALGADYLSAETDDLRVERTKDEFSNSSLLKKLQKAANYVCRDEELVKLINPDWRYIRVTSFRARGKLGLRGTERIDRMEGFLMRVMWRAFNGKRYSADFTRIED